MEYQDLPMHELRRMAKEREIRVAPTDKKVDIIKMLQTGETIHKPREVKRMHNIEDTVTPKSKPMLPHDFDAKIAHLTAKGLAYEIDEDSNCINFIPADIRNRAIIPTCINIDCGTERHIIACAEAAVNNYGNSQAIDDRNSEQANRIDQENRERKRLIEEAKAQVRAELAGA